jgi:cytosine/adenosine deaminase-related metal-dependent hydrolase
LIHCVRVNRVDMERIADAGASIAHCPVANARLGHGIAPVLEMLDCGVNVGLGSDSVASNNRIDVLEEARFAQILQRTQSCSATALPSDQLLYMATLAGARALGIDSRVGSLEVGKDADLCAVSLSGVHTRPVHDPLAALFHTARAPDVMMTIVRGKVLYRGGHWLSLDVAGVRARVESAGARLREARHA